METNDFHRHDNIDREVVEVSKSTLLLRLKECAEYAAIPAEILGYGGIALTLLGAAFLTENFHNIWHIPGETVRAAFLMGGVVSSVRTVYKIWQWSWTKGDHSPEATIASLTPLPFKPAALLNASNTAPETRKYRKTPQTSQKNFDAQKS